MEIHDIKPSKIKNYEAIYSFFSTSKFKSVITDTYNAHYIDVSKTAMPDKYPQLLAVSEGEEALGAIASIGGYIIGIYVDVGCRRMGYGTELINAHLRRNVSNTQKIAVAIHDSAGLAFLFSQGFRTIGKRFILTDARVDPTERVLLGRTMDTSLPEDDTGDDIEQELLTLVKNIIL